MKTLRAFLLGAALALGVASQAHAQPNPACPTSRPRREATVRGREHPHGGEAHRGRSRVLRKTIRCTTSSAASCRRTSATRRAGATTRTTRPPAALRPSPGFRVRDLGDGYIVTNAHVIDNAEEIFVRFTDKREMKAKVIGADSAPTSP